MSSTTYEKKGATIKFTPSEYWSSSEKTPSLREIQKGYSANLDKISMSGKAATGRTATVAAIELTADDGKYFSSIPRLSKKSSSNFKLRSTGVDKTIKKFNYTENQAPLPIKFTYDLLYRPKGKTTKADSNKVRIIYETKTIPDYTTKSITDVKFGSTTLNPKGEIRKITISGVRGSEFTMAINENKEEVITDAGGLVDNESYFDRTQDVSIISKSNGYEHELYGKPIKVLRGRIGSSGQYSFNQKFPSTVALKTAVDGTAGSGTKHVFRSVENVKVGDRIFCDGSIGIGTTVLVAAINPDGDKPKELQFDSSVNLQDKKEVKFERKRIYSIEMFPTSTSWSSNLSSVDSQVPPIFRLFQYKNVKLTITNKTDDANMKILVGPSYTDRSAGLDNSVSYSGAANTKAFSGGKTRVNKFSVDIKLSTVNSETFTALTRPTFSNKSQDGSKWTNSVTEFNGGTEVEIRKFKSSATGQQTLTISYDVIILKWGTKDVEMVVDWDVLTAHSGD